MEKLEIPIFLWQCASSWNEIFSNSLGPAENLHNYKNGLKSTGGIFSEIKDKRRPVAACSQWTIKCKRFCFSVIGQRILPTSYTIHVLHNAFKKKTWMLNLLVLYCQAGVYGSSTWVWKLWHDKMRQEMEIRLHYWRMNYILLVLKKDAIWR